MYQRLKYQKQKVNLAKDSDYVNESDDSDDGGDANTIHKPA